METRIEMINRKLREIDIAIKQLKKLGADDNEVKLSIQVYKISLLEKKFYLLFELGDLFNETD